MTRARWFIAHRKGVELESLEALRVALRSKLLELGNTEADLPELVLGIEDYDLRFAEAGGWDMWAMNWALGTEQDPENPQTVRDRYAVFIVPEHENIRRATGRALDLAMRRGKPVFWFAENYVDGMGEPQGSAFFQARRILQTGGNEQWPIFSLGF